MYLRSREDWVVVYDGEQPSYPMKECNAKNYLVIFDDALYIENRETGKRVYRKEVVSPENLKSAHLIFLSAGCIIGAYGLAGLCLWLGWKIPFQASFAVGSFSVVCFFVTLFEYLMDDPD